jgi:tetratricopeptide (TPR) repeat protein
MKRHPEPARTFPWIAAILAFAAASRIAYLLAYRGDPFWGQLLHDAQRYHDAARALASGAATEAGAFSQAPLYAWTLAFVYRACGPAPGAMYALQAVLGVAAIALVAGIARRAYGPAAAAGAAATAALCGVFPFHETKLLPGTIAAFLVLLLVERLQAADVSDRAGAWFAPGLALGAAALANTSLLLLGAPAAAWILADGGKPLGMRVRRLAFFALAAAALILPVTVRNRVVSGDWVLVATNGGITFWQGNNPAALGTYSTPAGFSGSIRTQREEARAIAEAETGATLTDAQASSYWMRRGLAYLARDPAHAAKLLAAKAALAAANREQPLEYDPGLDENPLRPLFIAPFGVVLGLAAARAFARGRGSRAEGPVVLVAAGVLAILLLFYVSSRYRLPGLALLCAPAGAGLAEIAARLRASVRGALAPAATAAAVAAASFAIGPAFFADLGRTQTAMVLGDRGAALRAAGRRGEAESSLREAARLAPGMAEVWKDLGVILYESGRIAEAEPAFAKAWSLAPDDRAAANNLLGTRLRLGLHAAAVALHDDMRRRGVPVDAALERALAAP